ncbi:MAG: hypothetical protein GF392_02310, partial [Candidatus Omnitrophica bacterium]|nr:hypothetical protein [Candidatus Omnitrophota bacterium]
MHRELKNRIRNGDAVITVMGLGYVGLPIALEFCQKGYSVYGLDNDRQRVGKLRGGVSYVEDISSDLVAGANRTGRFTASC